MLSPENVAKETDAEYFESYENLEVHKLMLQDQPRTLAYQKAILENKDYFHGKTVMDVGSGTGILSLFCFQAGAKRIYAVENAKMMGCIIEEVVVSNNAEHVIKVLHGRVEDIELPNNEKVDIIVSEWMGFYLLHESMLNSVLIAREKHLSDEGIMLPSHARLWAAPCNSGLTFWSKNVYGFDLTAVEAYARKKSKPNIDVLEEDALLSEPQLISEFNLKYLAEDEVKTINKRQFVSIVKDGSMNGLCLFFDTEFRIGEYSTLLSTSPKEEPTHWKQTIIPFPESIPVEQDDVIGWQVSLNQSQENARHYNMELNLLDPSVEEHPVPCDCQMAKCELIKKLFHADEEDNKLEII